MPRGLGIRCHTRLDGEAVLTVGATGVYIFDDTTGKAYWPDHFAELYARATR
jgi:hypothetical protein